MRTLTILSVVFSAVACSSPQPLPRAQLAPPLQLEPPAQLSGKAEAEAGRADRDQSASSPEVIGLGGSDEFDMVPPTYRTVRETVEVEVPVEADQPRVVLVEDGRRYSTYDNYIYERTAHRARRTSRFPINTALGAGIGAIIGHQRGRRDRGALIGGGIGLLLDLNRWSR